MYSAIHRQIEHLQQRIEVLLPHSNMIFSLPVVFHAITFTAIAIKLGSQSSYLDPQGMFTVRPRVEEVAATGNPLATGDPPARYVPIAVQTYLVPASTAILMAVFYLWNDLVLIPFAVFVLVWRVRSLRAANFALVITTLGLAVGVLAFPWPDGYWVYTQPIPWALFAATAQHEAVESLSDKWAVVTGVFVASVSWNQYYLGCLAVVAMYVAYALNREWRLTMISTATGIGCASYLLLRLARIDYYISQSSNHFVLRPLSDIYKLFVFFSNYQSQIIPLIVIGLVLLYVHQTRSITLAGWSVVFAASTVLFGIISIYYWMSIRAYWAAQYFAVAVLVANAPAKIREYDYT